MCAEKIDGQWKKERRTVETKWSRNIADFNYINLAKPACANWAEKRAKI